MKKLLTLLVSIFLVISCAKDEAPNDNQNLDQNDSTNNTDEFFAQENFGDLVSTNFIGKVMDETGNQIKDVTITIGNQSVLTDQNGIFVLNNISVYENFALIKANKYNYLKGAKVVVPTIDGTNDVQITLLRKNILGIVTSGVESEVVMTNGAKVSFLGEFIYANGTEYFGQVEISMHYLEPNNSTTFQQMPGMLFGKRENGTASSMETYGMLAVDLFTPSGEVLNIASDSPAILSFPLSTSTPNAIQEIPLWYFDEAVGYWKEQGIAILEDNMYVAEVNHFTWWNCDLPLDYINGCVNLTGSNELNDYYLEVIRTTNNQTIFSGFTNSSGIECGFFPVNENITIKVYDKCTQDVLSEDVYGPYSSDVVININVSITTTQLQANLVDCNNNPITNGYVWLLSSNATTDVIPIENGQINYNVSLCGEADYSMIVYDLEGQKTSELIEVDITSTEIIDLGMISVCNDDLGSIYVGDVLLETQYEVEEFSLLGYSIINGNLRIGPEYNNGGVEDDIVNVYSLNTLTKVTGSFNMVNNSSLQDLGGLHNLTDVLGNFTIEDNGMLYNLYWLNSLNYVGGNLTLTSNDDLTTVDGLQNLQSIGENLQIWNNNSLQSLLSFSSLTTIENRLHIQGNPSIGNLTGFDNLNSIGRDLDLLSNNFLSDLTALQSLTTIGNRIFIHDNQNLTNLNGLENVTGNVPIIIIGNSTYGGNTSLVDYCALSNLITSSSFTGNFNTSQNAFNPNIYDMLNGNCSQ